MKDIARKASLLFTAGALGGLVKGLLAWGCGYLGINAALGSRMAPQLTPFWVYQHVVWGGLWAWLFFLPLKKPTLSVRGMLFSLGQTAVSLLVMMPQMGRGLFGLQLGFTTPLLIAAFGLVWGLFTAFWLKLAGENF